ncbi:MAG: hypothetical protein ACR2OO_13050 [Thermomicrobiales bacterium]
MATIKLPKHLKGFRFPKAMPFEMNGLSLETILPQVFRLSMLEGRDSSRGTSEDADIAKSINILIRNPRLFGFDDVAGHELLGKIVRSSLIRMVRIQTTRQPQIDGLVPYSLASFKAGFPTNAVGFRQVDRFLYELLLEGWNNNSNNLQKFLVEAFGTGVKITGFPKPSASRIPGSHEGIDVVTELSLSYVDGFETVEPKRTANPYVASQPLVDFHRNFAMMLRQFLITYKNRLPIPLLIDQVIAIIGFQLSVMTVKSFHALPALIASPTSLPDAMVVDGGRKSPPEIYIDMTGNLKSNSRAMAISCVRRDQEQIDLFVRAVLKLRYLESAMTSLKRNPLFRTHIDAALDGKHTPEYLQALALMPEDTHIGPRIDVQVGGDVDAILELNIAESKVDDNEARSDAQHIVDRLVSDRASLDEQIVELLLISQIKTIRKNLGGWWLSIGGVGKPWGLINAPSDRRTWCYAPGNDLLSVLVQLRAVDYDGWDAETNPNPQRFGLRDFLEWLELRFGVIVDRPPAGLGFDSPEPMAAARENLQAMLRRLRQMGIFEDRSDDFSVQKLTPPFFEPAGSLVHS